jgi:uncharacterized protein YggE
MKYLLLASLMLLPTVVPAQVSGNANYAQQTPIDNDVARAQVNDGEIALSVSGLMNVKAETYVAFFHVIQVGETAESTDELLTQRIAKFRNSLQRIGIDTSAVHIDMISFVPKYDFNVLNKIFSKSYNEVPDGFELQKNIIVRYAHPSHLDAIVTAAASAEIYDLVKVEYFLSDLKKHYDQLRQRCLEELKARTQMYESVGIKLDTVMRKSIADDFGTILPQNRYTQYQAIARPSMLAVKKETGGASIKFRGLDVPVSRYYQAVPYDEYDLVINPVVGEPVVQLTYQVKMKFKLQAQNRNNYLLIGPNGQVQTLDVIAK